MGGVDAPPSARLLDLRSASREGGSLKPGGGKSPPDRQRRSFVAPGFVVARSAAPSTKNFEGPLYFASGASGALGALTFLQYSQDSSLQILGVPPSWAR